MAPRGTQAVAKPEVEQIIHLPPKYFRSQARKKMRFFLPDWDDRLDPDFDFKNEIHSGGMSSWTNEVYAHQVYPRPPYDGILASRINIEESKKKNAAIRASGGIHEWYRVPIEFPIMGDCGAFGYIKAKEPPYKPEETLDYYLTYGFTYGVSVDHLIVAETEGERQERWDITVENARAFLQAFEDRDSFDKPFTPMGAIQGWDKPSYVKAAKAVVKMGYKYMAIGGLVRSDTFETRRIVRAVMEVVPKDVQVHVFGIGRFTTLVDFAEMGVSSIDSASYLRKAWLKANQNFLTQDHGWYTSIRVPQSDGSKARKLIEAGKATREKLETAEQRCLKLLRQHDRHDDSPRKELLELVADYDAMLSPGKPDAKNLERITKTLTERPWRLCGCAICARWGIEVAIFRGNNRNRRRGFHNVHCFHRIMKRLIGGEQIPWIEKERR